MDATRISVNVGEVAAALASYIEILFSVILTLGLAGLLLEYHPLTKLVGIVIGGFALCFFIGLFLEAAIELLLISRKRLRRWWKQNTPPYIEIERSGLPVPDKSVSVAREKVRIYGIKSILVYLVSTAAAIYIAVVRPNWVRRVISPPLIEAGLTLLMVLMQIPPALFQLPGLKEMFSNTGVWDNAVRAVFLGPTVPLATATVANLQYVLYRKRREPYLQVSRNLFGRIYGELEFEKLTDGQYLVILIDILMFTFILAFIGSNI